MRLPVHKSKQYSIRDHDHDRPAQNDGAVHFDKTVHVNQALDAGHVYLHNQLAQLLSLIH